MIRISLRPDGIEPVRHSETCEFYAGTALLFLISFCVTILWCLEV